MTLEINQPVTGYNESVAQRRLIFLKVLDSHNSLSKSGWNAFKALLSQLILLFNDSTAVQIQTGAKGKPLKS